MNLFVLIAIVLVFTIICSIVYCKLDRTGKRVLIKAETELEIVIIEIKEIKTELIKLKEENSRLQSARDQRIAKHNDTERRCHNRRKCDRNSSNKDNGRHEDN